MPHCVNAVSVASHTVSHEYSSVETLYAWGFWYAVSTFDLEISISVSAIKTFYQLNSYPMPPAPQHPPTFFTLHTQTLYSAHGHVCRATFNMPVLFPSVERLTVRLSDCQSAVITFTALHWSAAPQTPGKSPQTLTFPWKKKQKKQNGLCKWRSRVAPFVD